MGFVFIESKGFLEFMWVFDGEVWIKKKECIVEVLRFWFGLLIIVGVFDGCVNCFMVGWVDMCLKCLESWVELML